MVARREGRGGAGEGGGAGHRPAARTSSRVRHSLGRPGSGGHQTQQGAAPHVTRCGTPSLGTRDCVASNVKCNLKHCFLEVSNANVTAARADPVFQTKPRPPYLTPPVQGAAKPGDQKWWRPSWKGLWSGAWGPRLPTGVFKAALLGHFQCLTQNHNACALDVPPVKMY